MMNAHPVLAVCMVMGTGLSAAGQTPSSLLPAVNASPAPTMPLSQAVRMGLAQGLSYLPATVEGDKDWGRQTRVWSGIRWDWSDEHPLFGGKLRTHRRYRDVDHGRWIRYELTLPDATHWTDNLAANSDGRDAVRVHSVSPRPDAKGRYRMRIELVAPVGFVVRVQRHVRGVRLHSVTIEGRLTVTADLDVAVGVLNDWSELPPAVLLDPHVHQANLDLRRFEVDRISRVGGNAAEAWGEIAQETILRVAIDKLNDDLAERLNRQIKRKRSKLRFSTRQAFVPAWSTDSTKPAPDLSTSP